MTTLPRRAPASAIDAAGAIALGLAAGLAAASHARWGIYGLLLAGAIAAGGFILARRSFEPLAGAMFVVLPLQSAFVIDAGITIRVAYLFGGLAILSALLFGRFRHAVHPALYWLAAFGVVIAGSLLLTPRAPAISFTSVSGIRGIFGLRPLIQCAQLALMVGCMFVTYSYCSSERMLRRATVLVLAGGIFALSYGAYGFVALLTRSHYVELNNARNTDFGTGYKEQGNSFAGGYVPRPRSTFQEPLNFGNFLIVVMAMASLARIRARARHSSSRHVWSAVLVIAVLLFLIGVNSRGAIFGTVAAAASLVTFSRRPAQVVRLVRSAALWLLVLAALAAVFVQARYKGGIPVFATYLTMRVTSAFASGNRISVDWALLAPLIREHPIIGVGFGNLPFYWGRLEGAAPLGVTEAGGLYMRLLAEVGILGTLLYLFFIGGLLAGLRRAGTRPRVSAELRSTAAAIFFVIVADAVQRIALVGIATDTHLWVIYGLALAIPPLARAEETASA